MLKNFPLPRISRIEPNIVNAIAKPRPIPKPSSMEGMALFLDANDSARPSTIQFTTINGMNNPKDSCKLGR